MWLPVATGVSPLAAAGELTAAPAIKRRAQKRKSPPPPPPLSQLCAATALELRNDTGRPARK